jgi:hypothetical protein
MNGSVWELGEWDKRIRAGEIGEVEGQEGRGGAFGDDLRENAIWKMSEYSIRRQVKRSK